MLKGVEKVESGYAGGKMDNPSYEAVSSGSTGHAECIRVTYNPSVISYEDLLTVFFASHDPTTINRQGNDVGTQYRSAIFYHNEKQKKAAIASKEKLEKSGKFRNPIVTAIVPISEFYKAEKYHQRYLEKRKSRIFNLF